MTTERIMNEGIQNNCLLKAYMSLYNIRKYKSGIGQSTDFVDELLIMWSTSKVKAEV